jgi:hypothetical protein
MKVNLVYVEGGTMTTSSSVEPRRVIVIDRHRHPDHLITACIAGMWHLQIYKAH